MLVQITETMKIGLNMLPTKKNIANALLQLERDFSQYKDFSYMDKRNKVVQLMADCKRIKTISKNSFTHEKLDSFLANCKQLSRFKTNQGSEYSLCVSRAIDDLSTIGSMIEH